MLATAWCAERAGDQYEACAAAMPVAVTAIKVADVIDVHASGHGRFAFQCSRCAERAELTMEFAFDHHFVGPGQLDAGDGGPVASFDADPDVSEHDGVHVALDELLIEHALLELPAAPLCSENCRGLCQACGSNLNVQPCACRPDHSARSVWAALEGFRPAADVAARTH